MKEEMETGRCGLEDIKLHSDVGQDDVVENSGVVDVAASFLKGDKFYVGFKVMENVTVAFIDSGSEISIINPRYVMNAEKQELEEPVELRGFDGTEGLSVFSKVEVKVNFGGVSTMMCFYLADIPTNIIGSDMLRRNSDQFSLNTADSILTVHGSSILTSKSPDEAMGRYGEMRRSADVGSCGIAAVMRLKEALTLAPATMCIVEACVTGKEVKNDAIFYSKFDDETAELYIPSALVEGEQRMMIPIHNKGEESVTLTAGLAIGRVWTNEDVGVCGITTSTYRLDEALELLKEASCAAATSGPEMAQGLKPEVVPGEGGRSFNELA